MKAAESVRRAFDGASESGARAGRDLDDVGQGNNMMRGPGGAKTATVPLTPADLTSTARSY